MRSFGVLTVVINYLLVCRGQFNVTPAVVPAPVPDPVPVYHAHDVPDPVLGVSAPYNGGGVQWPDNSAGCKIVWSSSYEGFAPLILVNSGTEIIRKDIVDDGTGLTFTCPDASNSFRKFNETYIYTICQNGTLFPVQIKELGCKTWVRATIRPERKIGAVTMACGANGIGKHYEIGFEADLSCPTNPQNIKWFPLISVCFDDRKETTIMTRHTLSYLGKADNKNPPDFRPSIGFFTVAMNTIYTQKEQAFLFSKERLNLQQEIICNSKYPNTYLQRGHMAPKGDFVTKAEQDATFYYINALPQWSTINNGNWKGIENSIRNFQKNNQHDLTIYTGGFEVLRLQDKNSQLEQVYLSDVYELDIPNKRQKVPVPAAIYKVVHSAPLNQAVAFMVSNYPFFDAPPPIENYIKTQCENVTWLININPTNPIKGLLACLTVEDFITAFPSINFPKLGSSDNNLLK